MDKKEKNKDIESKSSIESKLPRNDERLIQTSNKTCEIESKNNPNEDKFNIPEKSPKFASHNITFANSLNTNAHMNYNNIEVHESETICKKKSKELVFFKKKESRNNLEKKHSLPMKSTLIGQNYKKLLCNLSTADLENMDKNSKDNKKLPEKDISLNFPTKKNELNISDTLKTQIQREVDNLEHNKAILKSYFEKTTRLYKALNQKIRKRNLDTISDTDLSFKDRDILKKYDLNKYRIDYFISKYHLYIKKRINGIGTFSENLFERYYWGNKDDTNLGISGGKEKKLVNNCVSTNSFLSNSSYSNTTKTTKKVLNEKKETTHVIDNSIHEKSYPQTHDIMDSQCNIKDVKNFKSTDQQRPTPLEFRMVKNLYLTKNNDNNVTFDEFQFANTKKSYTKSNRKYRKNKLNDYKMQQNSPKTKNECVNVQMMNNSHSADQPHTNLMMNGSYDQILNSTYASKMVPNPKQTINRADYYIDTNNYNGSLKPDTNLNDMHLYKENINTNLNFDSKNHVSNKENFNFADLHMLKNSLECLNTNKNFGMESNNNFQQFQQYDNHLQKNRLDNCMSKIKFSEDNILDKSIEDISNFKKSDNYKVHNLDSKHNNSCKKSFYIDKKNSSAVQVNHMPFQPISTNVSDSLCKNHQDYRSNNNICEYEKGNVNEKNSFLDNQAINNTRLYSLYDYNGNKPKLHIDEQNENMHKEKQKLNFAIKNHVNNNNRENFCSHGFDIMEKNIENDHKNDFFCQYIKGTNRKPSNSNKSNPVSTNLYDNRKPACNNSLYINQKSKTESLCLERFSSKLESQNSKEFKYNDCDKTQNRMLFSPTKYTFNKRIRFKNNEYDKLNSINEIGKEHDSESFYNAHKNKNPVLATSNENLFEKQSEYNIHDCFYEKQDYNNPDKKYNICKESIDNRNINLNYQHPKIEEVDLNHDFIRKNNVFYPYNNQDKVHNYDKEQLFIENFNNCNNTNKNSLHHRNGTNICGKNIDEYSQYSRDFDKENDETKNRYEPDTLPKNKNIISENNNSIMNIYNQNSFSQADSEKIYGQRNNIYLSDQLKTQIIDTNNIYFDNKYYKNQYHQDYEMFHQNNKLYEQHQNFLEQGSERTNAFQNNFYNNTDPERMQYTDKYHHLLSYSSCNEKNLQNNYNECFKPYHQDFNQNIYTYNHFYPLEYNSTVNQYYDDQQNIRKSDTYYDFNENSAINSHKPSQYFSGNKYYNNFENIIEDTSISKGYGFSDQNNSDNIYHSSNSLNTNYIHDQIPFNKMILDSKVINDYSCMDNYQDMTDLSQKNNNLSAKFELSTGQMFNQQDNPHHSIENKINMNSRKMFANNGEYLPDMNDNIEKFNVDNASLYDQTTNYDKLYAHKKNNNSSSHLKSNNTNKDVNFITKNSEENQKNSFTNINTTNKNIAITKDKESLKKAKKQNIIKKEEIDESKP
ncbi:hypothetical protein EDEG_02836 [Edhazardia aedis USNM 41457]|uniref:Uncharacterized protein n=1 Tax=Edhazardia aedis (strain USNM 41457) TaxID=1003232 RepID=J9DJH2_EDHAE|nr:hypothetical protein EDEG_02836 [Edhazardia aedis USNM 41457]|eukprot:EJW02765.1 hypothetical protein EDEG_02836 [Edhazardia aedis USNM 41457]